MLQRSNNILPCNNSHITAIHEGRLTRIARPANTFTV